MYVMCLGDRGPSLTAPEPSQGAACLSFQSIFNRPVVTEAVWISDLQEKAPHLRYLWGGGEKERVVHNAYVRALD